MSDKHNPNKSTSGAFIFHVVANFSILYIPPDSILCVNNRISVYEFLLMINLKIMKGYPFNNRQNVTLQTVRKIVNPNQQNF